MKLSLVVLLLIRFALAFSSAVINDKFNILLPDKTNKPEKIEFI